MENNTIKLSKRTIEILKNFFTINQSILLRAGQVQSTMAVAKNIFAVAQIEETIPRECAIYNINSFLSVLGIFANPVLDFTEKFIQIREEGTNRGGCKYFYANQTMIEYPKKPVNMPPDILVDFELTRETFAKLTQSASVLGVGDLIVYGDNSGLSLIVTDRENASSNDFELVLSTEPQNESKFFIKTQNLKMIPGDYVAKFANGIAEFTTTDGLAKYHIALEV